MVLPGLNDAWVSVCKYAELTAVYSFISMALLGLGLYQPSSTVPMV